MKTKELDGEVKRILKCPQLAEVRNTDKSDSNIVDQIREAKMILDIVYSLYIQLKLALLFSFPQG